MIQHHYKMRQGISLKLQLLADPVPWLYILQFGALSPPE
jgi:hypothetical protein